MSDEGDDPNSGRAAARSPVDAVAITEAAAFETQATATAAAAEGGGGAISRPRAKKNSKRKSVGMYHAPQLHESGTDPFDCALLYALSTAEELKCQIAAQREEQEVCKLKMLLAREVTRTTQARIAAENATATAIAITKRQKQRVVSPAKVAAAAAAPAAAAAAAPRPKARIISKSVDVRSNLRFDRTHQPLVMSVATQNVMDDKKHTAAVGRTGAKSGGAAVSTACANTVVASTDATTARGVPVALQAAAANEFSAIPAAAAAAAAGGGDRDDEATGFRFAYAADGAAAGGGGGDGSGGDGDDDEGEGESEGEDADYDDAGAGYAPGVFENDEFPAPAFEDDSTAANAAATVALAAEAEHTSFAFTGQSTCPRNWLDVKQRMTAFRLIAQAPWSGLERERMRINELITQSWELPSGRQLALNFIECSSILIRCGLGPEGSLCPDSKRALQVAIKLRQHMHLHVSELDALELKQQKQTLLAGLKSNAQAKGASFTSTTARRGAVHSANRRKTRSFKKQQYGRLPYQQPAPSYNRYPQQHSEPYYASYDAPDVYEPQQQPQQQFRGGGSRGRGNRGSRGGGRGRGFGGRGDSAFF